MPDIHLPITASYDEWWDVDENINAVMWLRSIIMIIKLLIGATASHNMS